MTAFLEYTRSLSFASGFLAGAVVIGLPLFLTGWSFGEIRVLRYLIRAHREQEEAEMQDEPLVPLEKLARMQR